MLAMLARNSSEGSRSPTFAGPHFDRYGIVGQSRAIADVIRRVQLVASPAEQ